MKNRSLRGSFAKLKSGILDFIMNKTHFDRLIMILRSAGVVYLFFCIFRFATLAGMFAGRTTWARSARGGCPAKQRGGGMMPARTN